MLATELKDLEQCGIPDRFFLEMQYYFLIGRKKILDTFRCGIFPFKSLDIHPDDLKTALTHERPTTPPVIKDYHQVYLKS